MLTLHGTMLAVPALLLIIHSCGLSFGFCIFKKVFGIDCPACGITHSVMALMTGHVKSALHYHPAGPFILLLLAVMVAYLSATVLTRYRGMTWKTEVALYQLLDRTMVGMLLIGWCIKFCIN